MIRVLSVALVLVLVLPLGAVQAETNTPPGWSVNAGVNLGSYKYEEPDIMNLKGTMVRVGIGVTRHTPELYYSLDLVYGFGGRKYTGSTQTLGGEVVPLTISGIDDKLYEFRGLLGKSFPVGTSSLSVAMGYGYRSLDDGLGEFQEGGYDRHSRYQYIPIQLSLDRSLSQKINGGQLKTTLEYDYFISGTQTSDLSDLNFDYYSGDTVGASFTDVENTQNSGSGFKGSISWLFSTKPTGVNPMLTLYFEGWWIDNSTVDPSTFTVLHQNPTNNEVSQLWFMEPENNTKELGVRLSLYWL